MTREKLRLNKANKAKIIPTNFPERDLKTKIENETNKSKHITRADQVTNIQQITRDSENEHKKVNRSRELIKSTIFNRSQESMKTKAEKNRSRKLIRSIILTSS